MELREPHLGLKELYNILRELDQAVRSVTQGSRILTERQRERERERERERGREREREISDENLNHCSQKTDFTLFQTSWLP